MSEIPGYTLEDFLLWDFGYINDDLIQRYEICRKDVELWLDGFDEETQSWRDYALGRPACLDKIEGDKK